MNHPIRLDRGTVALLLALCMVVPACVDAAAEGETTDAQESVESSSPRVVAESPEAAGRYLVIVAGCNDCHTDGYLASNGNVPEDQWLAGSALGWRGPWGTTYAANLRLRANEMSEDAWVARLHEGGGLPPMPWVNVGEMSEEDARAMYRFVRSLGPAGEHVPSPVPPDQEPGTPYVNLQPTMPSDQ